MNNKTAKRVMAMLIVTVMCFTLFSFGVSAVSLDRRGSITLTTFDKETKEPISGAVFRIYFFAYAYSVGDRISYVYTDDFKDNGMEMGNFSDAYLPIHLKAYAESKSIPYTEKATDSKGKVVFNNLPCGAYLVVPVGVEDGYLSPNPFIVAVPIKDETNDKWIYDVDATPKIESDKEDGEKTYISVKKYWKSEGKNPDSIKVSLIKDGAVVDTVILNAGNNWYHRWDTLSKNHSWSVVETNVPDGYTVSYVTSEMTVIITNTDEDYEEETTTGKDETTTGSDKTTSPDDTTTPGDVTEVTTEPTDVTESTTLPDGTTENTTDNTATTVTTTKVTTTKGKNQNETTTKPEELIDTGQLNWPVPVCAIAGLLIFSAGWAMLNFGKKDEEAV
ncbi:MAG: hypothetical protein II356_03270 [Clostridia bacterium]|nr:hypothetical protein [Clostridia bacterium]